MHMKWEVGQKREETKERRSQQVHVLAICL